jgi:uncharacterized phage-like protein YoqJ
MKRVCITGHRPPKIGGYDPDNELRCWVRESLRTVMDEIRPSYAYSGMALGADLDFVEICLDMGIPFTAVLPFEGQERKWPEETQLYYWRLVHKAQSFLYVCDPGYAPWKLQRRNEWMVDEIGSDGIVIAVWDGSTSGTGNCVRYARASQRHITRIDPNTRTISR